MSGNEQYQKRTESMAHHRASMALVPPLRVVFDQNFPRLDRFLYGMKGVGNAQVKLDESIGKGPLLHVDAGVKAKIVYWDSLSGVVAGFDPDGNQVGFGQAIWSPDPRQREKDERFMAYNTAYVVASQFEGRGIATAMAILLENHAATNTVGIGASFLYDIEAETSERKMAVERILKKLGAVLMSDKIHYTRILIKPEDFIFRPGQSTIPPGIVIVPSSEIKISSSY